MAYGRKGDIAQADLASAQAAFPSGDFRTARQFAKRAKEHFPVGAPGWVKADDIAELQAAGAAERPPASSTLLIAGPPAHALMAIAMRGQNHETHC